MVIFTFQSQFDIAHPFPALYIQNIVCVCVCMCVRACVRKMISFRSLRPRLRLVKWISRVTHTSCSNQSDAICFVWGFLPPGADKT